LYLTTCFVAAHYLHMPWLMKNKKTVPVWVSVEEVALDVDAAVVVKTPADIKTVVFVLVVVFDREGEDWV
jgi:hypothetical protein